MLELFSKHFSVWKDKCTGKAEGDDEDWDRINLQILIKGHLHIMIRVGNVTTTMMIMSRTMIIVMVMLMPIWAEWWKAISRVSCAACVCPLLPPSASQPWPVLEIAINIIEEDEQDDVYNWQVLAEFIRLFEQNLILPTWLLCSKCMSCGCFCLPVGTSPNPGMRGS